MSRRGRPNTEIPDHAIDALFGRGHDAEKWKTELEEQGYIWNPGLRNRIIGRQFLFFKGEIGRLLSGPATRRADGTISNSCKSILEVLKGETGERAQRLQNRRLFGPESSSRTLEAKVKHWREEDPSYSLPPPPNHAPQVPLGDIAIRSRQDDRNHNVPWTPHLMSSETLLTDTPEFGDLNNTNPSMSSSAPDGFHLAMNHTNNHQYLSTQENSQSWNYGTAMMNSASGYALADDDTFPHDPYVLERQIVQPYLNTSHAASPTNYASSTPNQPNQSDIERVLLAALSPAFPPHHSNTAPDSAQTTVALTQLPLTDGQWRVGVATKLLEAIAGQPPYDDSVTFEGPETETFHNYDPVDQSTEPSGQDTEMLYINDLQPSKYNKISGESRLQLAEFLHRLVPTSQLAHMAKHSVRAHRGRRNRIHNKVFREARLRRKSFHLHSKHQKLRRDFKNTTIALEQKVSTLQEKDAEILKLTGRIRDLELLEIHASEMIRQEAGLAKQKDAAKKANSDPPLNYSTEEDNENPPKRSRVMTSNSPLPLKLHPSKPPPPLSFYPMIRPQMSAPDHRVLLREGREVEQSPRPNSRNREKTPEPTTKETVKEDRSPKRSLKKKISDVLLGKKFEPAPPVPRRKDFQVSKSLPAPPKDSDIENDDATKRFTVATIDSGYQSLDIPSARNSVGSIQ